MDKKLRIRQIRSVINTQENHKRTIRALGIRRMQQEVILPDNPQTRGMIHAVRHLVTFEEVKG
jgi:large subunit ribosomal protein L30